MKTLGPLLLDFDKLSICFNRDGKEVCLQGLTKPIATSLDFVSSKAIQKFCAVNKQVVAFQLYLINVDTNQESLSLSKNESFSL